MSRNYAAGTRHMGDAGKVFLTQARQRKELSFSSVKTLGNKWSGFAKWAKEQGVGRLERVDQALVITYGNQLAEKVVAGDLKPAAAQNYLSAVNSVMRLATRGQWNSVSPTRQCSIPERSSVRVVAPAGLDRVVYQTALNGVHERFGARAAALVELTREFGLRSKEACLMDTRAAFKQARENGFLRITDGTKGGRPRELPVSPAQLEVLKRASLAQGVERALMPANKNLAEWRDGGLRRIRDQVKAVTGKGIHDLRAGYACERYSALAGHAAPAAGGAIESRLVDHEARAQVASELGHGRTDVTISYVGSRA